MIDAFILRFDRFLRTVAATPPVALRQPTLPEATSLSEPERKHAAGLMRVNHSGEIAAQALYDGQALFARSPEIRETLALAAREEQDHLAWTAQRLNELNAAQSLFNPIWYAGSFALGAASAALGDRASMAFLKATEDQVEAHLSAHLTRLPEADTRSRAIVETMRADEAAHAQTAVNHGGIDPPAPIRTLMALTAKIMTTASYRC
jgi:3-demethoxyubiquinol 3-hydroxylase